MQGRNGEGHVGRWGVDEVAGGVRGVAKLKNCRRCVQLRQSTSGLTPKSGRSARSTVCGEARLCISLACDVLARPESMSYFSCAAVRDPADSVARAR